jgi:hypothetical protein
MSVLDEIVSEVEGLNRQIAFWHEKLRELNAMYIDYLKEKRLVEDFRKWEQENKKTEVLRW